MFYLGILFVFIGLWQAFMKGQWSLAISGIALIFGTSFIFIGNLRLGIFFVFIFASLVILMQIFRLSTYHKYFYIMTVVIITYAVFIVFLLRKFDFQKYFWWYLMANIIFLSISYIKQNQAKNLFTAFLNNENKIGASIKNTLKYHLLSSIIFIFSIVIVYFIN